MDRFRWMTLAAVAWALAALPSAALAENRAGAFTLSPMAGGHIFEGDQNLKNSATFGLGLGYNLTEHVGLEGSLFMTDAEAKGPLNSDVDVSLYRLDTLYHFLPQQALVPYLAGGVGGISLDPSVGGSQDNFVLNWGAGVKYFVTEDLALRGDVRHVIDVDDPDHNLLYTAGLVYLIGGEKPAPPPKPVIGDADGDGVPDDRDKCPDTRKGEMVDDEGCTLKLTLHINFDFDKAEIKPEFKPDLDRAARFIVKYDYVPYILIEGHTDWIGEEAYNQALSERRAKAVREYLIANYGIDGKRLFPRGEGELRPVADNKTEEGRYQNRRVEIICCVLLPE